jgi:hypothetical protein
MGKRISAASCRAKAADEGTGTERGGKRAETVHKNANDHERQARVHPATPCYYVVVSGAGARGESINGAIRNQMGTTGALFKGRANGE